MLRAANSAGVGTRGFPYHAGMLTTAHLCCVVLCVLSHRFSSRRETAGGLLVNRSLKINERLAHYEITVSVIGFKIMINYSTRARWI